MSDDTRQKVVMIFREEIWAKLSCHDLTWTNLGKARARIIDRIVLLLEAEPWRIVVPIQSLAPNSLEIIQSIMAVVQQENGVFVASFVEANINGSGDSQDDAIEMLKDRIAASFRLLTRKEPVLGDDPRRQLAVLKQFVGQKAEPPKSQEERVREVDKMISDYLRPGQPLCFGIITKIEYANDDIVNYPMMMGKLAEQIVATEPRAMSREGMLDVLLAHARHEKLTSLVNDLETDCLSSLTCGALTAIDALAGKLAVEKLKETK